MSDRESSQNKDDQKPKTNFWDKSFLSDSDTSADIPDARKLSDMAGELAREMLDSDQEGEQEIPKADEPATEAILTSLDSLKANKPVPPAASEKPEEDVSEEPEASASPETESEQQDEEEEYVDPRPLPPPPPEKEDLGIGANIENLLKKGVVTPLFRAKIFEDAVSAAESVNLHLTDDEIEMLKSIDDLKLSGLMNRVEIGPGERDILMTEDLSSLIQDSGAAEDKEEEPAPGKPASDGPMQKVMYLVKPENEDEREGVIDVLMMTKGMKRDTAESMCDQDAIRIAVMNEANKERISLIERMTAGYDLKVEIREEPGDAEEAVSEKPPVMPASRKLTDLGGIIPGLNDMEQYEEDPTGVSEFPILLPSGEMVETAAGLSDLYRITAKNPGSSEEIDKLLNLIAMVTGRPVDELNVFRDRDIIPVADVHTREYGKKVALPFIKQNFNLSVEGLG